jgi:hypothetical protein
VALDPTRLTRVDTDDRPFLQAGLSVGYALLPLPLFLVLATIAWRLGLHVRARGLSRGGVRWAALAFTVLGIVGGLLETIVVGRLSRADPAGVPMGAALLWPIFLAGYLVPCGLRLGDAVPSTRRAAVLAAVVAIAAALGMGVTLDRSLAAMIAASALAGIGIATLFVALAGDLEPAARGRAWGLTQIGAVLGLTLFQTLVYALGFQWLLIGLAIVAALLGGATLMLLPARPDAAAEEAWIGSEAPSSAS